MILLPRRSRRADDLFDAHVRDSRSEIPAVDSVAVTNQKRWSSIIRKRLDNLLSSPLGRWMRGDVEMHNAPAMMAQHDERE